VSPVELFIPELPYENSEAFDTTSKLHKIPEKLFDGMTLLLNIFGKIQFDSDLYLSPPELQAKSPELSYVAILELCDHV